jgi:hypothetical protein
VDEQIVRKNFEIVEEDGGIVYATALSPPPWHRPQESMLVYNPAGPNDERVEFSYFSSCLINHLYRQSLER